LLPFREALRSLAHAHGCPITVVVVTPPFPSAGTGPLRVVRVGEHPGGVTLCGAYEGYVRL